MHEILHTIMLRHIKEVIRPPIRTVCKPVTPHVVTIPQHSKLIQLLLYQVMEDCSKALLVQHILTAKYTCVLKLLCMYMRLFYNIII